MDKKRITWYIVVPLSSALVMVLMYFSGIDALRQIVSPVMKGVFPDSQREFGLLENLQNLLLLITLGFMIHALFRKDSHIERGAFIGGAIITMFIFLEEVDYGLHYYEYLRGIDADEAATKRNWHNVGDRTDTSKKLMDAGMILLFVVLPLFFSNVKHKYLRYIVPTRWAILTLIGSKLVSEFAHLLNNMGLSEGGNINSNISEFREYVNYWLIMIFVYEVAYLRSLHDDPQNPTPMEPEPATSD